MLQSLKLWHLTSWPVCTLLFVLYCVFSRYFSNPFERDRKQLIAPRGSKGALHTINPTTSNSEAPGARMALLEFLSSTGLTLKTYHKELYQSLEQTLAKLNSSVQSEEHSFASVTPMLRPHKRVPQAFSLIEEVSELESEGVVGNGSIHSHSAQIDSDKTSKTVLYPRGAYPIPSVVAQPVSPEPEYVASLEVRL